MSFNDFQSQKHKIHKTYRSHIVFAALCDGNGSFELYTHFFHSSIYPFFIQFANLFALHLYRQCPSTVVIFAIVGFFSLPGFALCLYIGTDFMQCIVYHAMNL